MVLICFNSFRLTEVACNAGGGQYQIDDDEYVACVSDADEYNCARLALLSWSIRSMFKVFSCIFFLSELGLGSPSLHTPAHLKQDIYEQKTLH